VNELPLSPTERSTIRRVSERAVLDRAALHAILDAGLICHLAFVTKAGDPVVIPTGYGRAGDTLYLHGSTGATSLRAGMAGAQVCVNVTLVDGIVYSRSAFHHSMNYRSATVHGVPVPVTDPDVKLDALRVITEHLAPGSWAHTRLPNRRESAATAVLALDLTEAAVKVRAGTPGEDEVDLAPDVNGSVWAGVLPLHHAWGTPQPCPELPDGTDVPTYVTERMVRSER
jgi:uncharacterized protein